MRRLGSSEIAAVCALYMPQLAIDMPKNKTAGDVFCRLRWGLQQPKNARMDRGLREEQMLLDYYAKHIGPWWREKPLGEWWTVVDRFNADFTASPDAWDAPTPRIVIEGKTWSEKWGRGQWGTPGTDEMATRYHYQTQWLLARCEAEECHVLVMFGNDVDAEAVCAACHGSGGVPQFAYQPPECCPDCIGTGKTKTSEFIVTEPAIYPVKRNDSLIATLDACGERFLEEFVRPGIPPPVKPHDNRRKAKEKLNEERGQGAADEWYERCEERERADATASAAAQAEPGAEAC